MGNKIFNDILYLIYKRPYEFNGEEVEAITSVIDEELELIENDPDKQVLTDKKIKRHRAMMRRIKRRLRRDDKTWNKKDIKRIREVD